MYKFIKNTIKNVAHEAFSVKIKENYRTQLDDSRRFETYDPSTHFQFTVAHTLGFSVFSSHLLARISTHFKSLEVFVLLRPKSLCTPVLIFTHSLTHGAEPFLRSCQLCSHSRNSQRFMEPEGSLPS
jgi:hypothetical protein